LPTKGGTLVTLTGNSFGDRDRFDGLTVTYGRADGARFIAQGCNMTIPQREIVCRTAPGVGFGHRWQVAYDLASSSSLSEDTTSYAPPNATQVDPAYNSSSGGFSTVGGEVVQLRGRNFGPLGTAASASYQLPVGQGFDDGATLGGSTFHATGCNVTVAHVEITCYSSPGVGAGHVWEVSVGNQTSQVSVTQTTRYAAPSINRYASYLAAVVTQSPSLSPTLPPNATATTLAPSPAPGPGQGNPGGASNDVLLGDAIATSMLDTRGGNLVVITGSNFGESVDKNLIVAQYGVNTSASSSAISALTMLSQSVFTATKCSVTVAHIEITCATVEGVGANHTWKFQVGNQVLDTSSSSSTSVVVSTSYRPPAPSDWTISSLAQANALSTVGGEALYIEGDYFGPVGSTPSVIVSAMYVNPSLRGLGGSTFMAHNCSVAMSHVLLVCETAPGVGLDHKWTITVGLQDQQEGSSTFLHSSYASPALTSVVADTSSGLFSTAGNEWALLEGSNFGPADVSNVVNGSYGNPALASLGLPLVGDTYLSPSCVVLNHTTAKCRTLPGLGYSQLWSLTVGQQTWPRAGANATYFDGANSPSVRTSYSPPSFTSLSGPRSVVMDGGRKPMLLLNATGSETVVVTGANFGPLTANAAVTVTYANPYLDGLGGSTYSPVCTITVAHTELTCTTLPGVGYNHTWQVTVGNQTRPVDYFKAAVTSYAAPSVASLDHEVLATGMATDGSTVLTVTGTNFGPVVEDNFLFATYQPTASSSNLEGESHLTSCNVTVADVEAVCSSAPGVGANFEVLLSVGGQASAPFKQRVSYTKPQVAQLSTLLGANGTLATSGGDVAILTGTNLGPLLTSNRATALYKAVNLLPSSLADGVEMGYSLETLELRADQCNVTVAHVEMKCFTAPGVGRNFRFKIDVGGQVSNYSSEAISYTPPSITGVDADTSAVVSRDLDASNNVVGLEFNTDARSAADGVTPLTVTITGEQFGPVNDANTINVQLYNPTLAVANAKNNNGFGAPLAASFALINCSVTVADSEAECRLPPGVGFNHSWTITVGSQGSNAAPDFSSAYSAPAPTDVVVIANATGGTQLDEGLDTSGGGVVELTGTNFGPLSATANLVFAATFSETCANCSYTELGLVTDSNAGREGYNFLASSCVVTVAHTKMQCTVGAGVGRNHTWQVFVGARASAPLLTVQTSYAPPQLSGLSPFMGPVVVSSLSDAVPVSLFGKFLGNSDLCMATVKVYIEEESFEATGGSGSTGFSGVYTPAVLPKKASAHSDELVQFITPDLTGGQVLVYKSQTAFLSVVVGGVEVVSSLRLPYRFFEVQNVYPFNAPRPNDASCTTVSNISVYGVGFVTGSEYTATAQTRDEMGGGTFESYDVANVGVSGGTVILGDANDGKDVFTNGYKRLDCEVASSTELACPVTPGYDGPPVDESVSEIVLEPLVSMTNATAWSSICSSPVIPRGTIDLYPYPVDESGEKLLDEVSEGCAFTYWSLPRLDATFPPTGPLGGNTSVTLRGDYFEGSGKLFALFGDDYVQCRIKSVTEAVCDAPAYDRTLLASESDYGGARVALKIQLDEASIVQRICLEGQNTSFYYHPDLLSVQGPYPPLLPAEGEVAQSLVLDASPFINEGKLSGASDFATSYNLFTVDNGAEQSSADREEYVKVNVSFPSAIETGSFQLAELALDTTGEVSRGAMRSDCGDVSFWLSDHATSLQYWLVPNTCNATNTRFVVKVPGPQAANLRMYVSFGSGTADATMDGSSVFALSDGYTSWALGSSPASEAWSYPGESGSKQQQEARYRYRLDSDYEGLGLERHQYRGPWDGLVMQETVKAYPAEQGIRVDAGWQTPVPDEANLVLYLSEHKETPYVRPSNDDNAPEKWAPRVAGSLYASASTSSENWRRGPLLRVWGADSQGRPFSSAAHCAAVAKASSGNWSVEGAEMSLRVNGADLDQSSLRVQYTLAGTGVVSCDPLQGFGTRVWGAGRGDDYWKFPNSSLTAAQELEAADLAAGTGGWSFAPFYDMRVYSGVDQASNASTFFLGAGDADYDRGWANGHAWLTVGNGNGADVSAERTPAVADDGARVWWRLRYATNERPSTSAETGPGGSGAVALNLNGQPGGGRHQFTRNLTEGYVYLLPSGVSVSPSTIDLSNYDKDATNLNLTLTSSEITAAIASIGDSGLGWYDLPLNLLEFGGSALPDEVSVDLQLKVGTHSGAPCVAATIPATGEPALSCSLSGAFKNDLMHDSDGSGFLLSLSANGGASYTPLAGANLTFYQMSANFSGSLASSFYGGTRLSGSLSLESVGAARSYSFMNSSLVVSGQTSEVVMAAGGSLDDHTSSSGNGMLAMTLGPGTGSAVLSFNATLPHAEGIYARDIDWLDAPTPAPSLMNASMPPTVTPPSQCTNALSYECPPDSMLNCSACPTAEREGSVYPCYRPSALADTSGRCLPPRGQAARFVAGEDAALLIQTALRVDEGDAVTTVLNPGDTLYIYDPRTLIEGMDPLGAAAKRRSSDEPTIVTFSGDRLSTKMTPLLTLSSSSGQMKSSGVSSRLRSELADAYGFYPRTASEYPDATASVDYNEVYLLSQSTRWQAVYFASELSDGHFSGGDLISALYLKVSGAPRSNLVNLRVRLGHTNRTTLVSSYALDGDAPSASQLECPVADEASSLVFGPDSLSVGTLEANRDDVEDFWFKLELASAFAWDGISNLLVDVSYQAEDWDVDVKRQDGSQYEVGNLLLRATYGADRTAVTYGSAGTHPVVYPFIPALKLEVNNTVVLSHSVSEEFPSGVSGTTFASTLDVSVNNQPQAFLAAESARIVPGAYMYLNLSSDASTAENLAKDPATQNELKSIVVAALASAYSKVSASNIVLTGVGSDLATSGSNSNNRRRRLLNTGDVDTVVEFKAVSSDSFTVTEKSSTGLHDQLVDSSDSMKTDLAASTTLSGVTSLTASTTFEVIGGNETEETFFSTASFSIYNTRSIVVGSLDPSLSSTAGGTEVVISGVGYFTPTTEDGLVRIRWTVDNRDVWLTSTGTVGSCGTVNKVTGAKSECTEIYTVVPKADASFVVDGTLKVFVLVSFNGVTYTSKSQVAYLNYYKTPRMNSFYLLDPYPTAIPHSVFTEDDDLYRLSYRMPQSGTVYDASLKKDVQLYLYINASNVYLSSSTTVCIFLFDATGGDDDNFDNCLEEDRCVASDADLVKTPTAFNAEPGFTYIKGSQFLESAEFACPVPSTTSGIVRVSFSSNGFNGNERALDPEGSFASQFGTTVLSYGCSPGEYASSSNVACRKCAAGKVANTDGKSCIACPRRTYQPNEGSIACLDCPYNTDTNTTGTDTATHCVCSEGYYNLAGVGGVECDACIDDAVCPGARELPYPVQGFYRVGYSSNPALSETSATVKPCEPTTACLGGPDNSCAEGYVGDRCALCDEGYFRLNHYCTACLDSTLVSYILPVQLIGFVVAVLTLSLGFDTFSKYATMSIFVRFCQLLMVLSFYEISWTGSFSLYYVHSRGVLDYVNSEVFPINFFPIFKTANFFAPFLFFPLFESTSMPTCPNDRHIDWEGVVDGFFKSDYYSLDSLGIWAVAVTLFLEFVCHGQSNRLLRFKQRLVAFVATCCPAAAAYVVKHVVCPLGSQEDTGACVANTGASRIVMFIMVGGFAFVCSTFFGIATAEAGLTKANSGMWCFLTRNKRTRYAGLEAIIQLRSVLLVAISVVTNNGVFQAGLAICLLLLSLIFQILRKPFKSNSANLLESVSLAALVVIAFVGMVGSIGKLPVQELALTLSYAGYGLVFVAVLYGVSVVTHEVLDSRREAATQAKYVRVSLGLQQPSAAEVAQEARSASLVSFVRELVQAMLQGDIAGPSGVRGVGACPFPDEQIAQLLNNSEFLYSVKMMRKTMFRSFVLSETKGFFRRICTHPDVTEALAAAMFLGRGRSRSKGRAKDGGVHVRSIMGADRLEKEEDHLDEDTADDNSGKKKSAAARRKEAAKEKQRAAKKVVKEERLKRTDQSLRTVLFRLIDKVSRYLTARMLQAPSTYQMVHGITKADTLWAERTGAAKISQEMWTRIRKLFLRRLEPFPSAVRRALHCNTEEDFGTHYITPWSALLGPIAEAKLETWFTTSGAGAAREVKAKMLDCMFDPEQKVAYTVETLQRLRSLLVTEPSSQHSSVVGIVKGKKRSVFSSSDVGMDNLKIVKAGNIVEVRVMLNNCYRDRTDPKLGADGWSVRLLRSREMSARQVKGQGTSAARPVVLRDANFQATMNTGSAKAAKLFNVFAEGWSCHPSPANSSVPCLQIDLGRLTRIAALSFQGGSIFGLKAVHEQPATVAKEAMYAIQAALSALQSHADVVRVAVAENKYKKKGVLWDSKAKVDKSASSLLRAARRKAQQAAEGSEDAESVLSVGDEELPMGTCQALQEAGALKIALKAMQYVGHTPSAESANPTGDAGAAVKKPLSAAEKKKAAAAAKKAKKAKKGKEETKSEEESESSSSEEEEEPIDPRDDPDESKQRAAEERRLDRAFERLSRLEKEQEDAILMVRGARAAVKKAESAGKSKDEIKRLREEAAKLPGVRETEVGAYVPFAIALVLHSRGRYDDAEEQLRRCISKLDLLALRRPAMMAGFGGSGADEEGEKRGGVMGMLGYGKNDEVKDDPAMSLDPLREQRISNLRSIALEQMALGKWAAYQLKTGLNSLKYERKSGQVNSKSDGGIFGMQPLSDTRGSLGGDDEGIDEVKNDADLGLYDEKSPKSALMASDPKHRRRSTKNLTFTLGEDEDEDERNPLSLGGDGDVSNMTEKERRALMLKTMSAAMADVAQCIEAFGQAVQHNGYSYAAQTGLAAAQEELRRLRRAEDEVNAVDPMLMGGQLGGAQLVLARKAAKAKATQANVLAAGPTDETLQVSDAFMNPAWVTKLTVEFSKDKVSWHAAQTLDGLRDPEMVKRVYLPPPPPVNATTGAPSQPDPYEARYVRFKPAVELNLDSANKKKSKKGGQAQQNNWHHHVAMRVGVEEITSKSADEEVFFANAGGWDPAHPEDYDVKFLRRSLGIRLSEDPIKLGGDMEAMPIVSMVAANKQWPRVGDLLVAVGSEPVKGTPLSLITAAVMEGRRPLTLRFMPREKWHQQIEAASYDLVYAQDQLGIQVQVHEDTKMPVVTMAATSPMHVSQGPWDASKPEVDDQIVGIKKVGEPEFEMLLSAEAEGRDPYQRMIDLITTGGRPIHIKFLPPLARREAQAQNAAVASSSNAVPNTGSSSPKGTPLSPTSVELDAAAAEASSKDLHSKLTRFEVVFTEPTLGLGLQCGEEADDLPVVSSAPPGLSRPGVGDVMETVNGVSLMATGDAYSKAIELITQGGRPCTIGFVAVPTVTYDLVFEAPRLGIGLLEREGQMPMVETNNSGRAQPSTGDRLVAVQGNDLKTVKDPYAFAVTKIKAEGRPLTLTFETAMQGAQAAAVLKAAAQRERQGKGGPSPTASPAVRPMQLSRLPSNLKKAPSNFNLMGSLGAPAISIDDASDDEERGAPPRLAPGEDQGSSGGSALATLWDTTVRSRLNRRKQQQRLSAFEPAPYEGVDGGAPASEIADADFDYKECVFKNAKLGLDLLGGASTGHLPVLGSALEVDSASGGKVMLHEGDQVVAVAGVSLVDSEDPFDKCVDLITAHPARPIKVRFLTANSPGPYTVLFPSESLGVKFEVDEADPSAFPVVADASNCPLPFPLAGDKLLGVAGQALGHPMDKLAEAVGLVKGSPRPLKMLFQSPATTSAAPPSSAPLPAAASSPPVEPSRTYDLTFESASLGVSLLDEGDLLPVIDSAENALCTPQPKAFTPGAVRMPLPGHRIAKVNGRSVLSSGKAPYEHAVELITSLPRPLQVAFAPPPTYTLTFPEMKLGVSLEDVSEEHSMPSVLTGGCVLSPSLPLAGDVVLEVNGTKIESSNLLESSYDQAVRLITTSPRPLSVVFGAPSAVPSPATAPPASDSTSIVKSPPLPQPPVEPAAPPAAAVAAADTSVVTAPPSSSGSSDRPQHYEVVFTADRLGMGLQSGEHESDLPIVSSAPPDSALPLVGDHLESVNGKSLVGSKDAYNDAISLITSAGRPLTLGFTVAPPIRADGTYEVVFPNSKLGLGLVGDEHNSRGMPVVSEAPPGFNLPIAGHVLISVNGVSLEGAPDPYSKAVDLITSAGRPVTIGFSATPPQVTAPPALPTPESDGYEVVFTAPKLGLGLQAADEPSHFPVVSSAPDLRNGGKPRVGDLLTSVNGISLAGSKDAYEYAIDLISGSSRPVTIGFKPGVAASAGTMSGAELAVGVYEVEFVRDKLGLGLQAADDPRELPTVSSPPAGKQLPEAGHQMVSINGYSLAGSPDTYEKAIEIITTSGRPIQIGFRAPNGSLTSAAATANSLAAGGALAKNAMAGLTPSERVNALFDLLDANKDGVLSKAEVVAGAPQLRMSLFEAGQLFDLLDANHDGVLQRKEFQSLVGSSSKSSGKGGAPAFALPSALYDLLGVSPSEVGSQRQRATLKRSDAVLHPDGSYSLTFRKQSKNKGQLPHFGFRLVEGPRRALAPRVDTMGYQQIASPTSLSSRGDDEKSNSTVVGWPLAGDALSAVNGRLIELDGVTDGFEAAVKELEAAADDESIQITFRPPPNDADLPEEDDDDDDEKKKALKRPESTLALRPGLEDDEEEEDDEEVAGLWGGGDAPLEVDLGNGNYAVQFLAPECHVKLMENVDRRFAPVVAKAFPGATMLQRGHLLVSVNNRPVDSRRSATNEPFSTALDLLKVATIPCSLEFSRPPSVASIKAVEGAAGVYDALFEGAELGLDLAGYGAKGQVVRVVGTHPIGVPHLGDQVVGINGHSLLSANRDNTEDGKAIAKDPLGYIKKLVEDTSARPLTLRLQRSTGEMAAGEELLEARRGFSVLFMSATLGLSFDLKTGVPVVDEVKPVFTVPRSGDVLTAINGAELSKCALTVNQLTLMLKALPRPLKLSFVEGSKSLQDALKATTLKGEGPMAYPEHFLRQVVVPGSAKRTGIKLMTISNRPVVQAITNPALLSQGLRPCDVIVSVDGKHVGENTTALEVVSMLQEARISNQTIGAKGRRQVRTLKIGVLRMAPLDKNSSYNSQHPIDVAAALSTHDQRNGMGCLSFSMPGNLPADKYKVEVYRFGSQVAPMMSGGSHERDHYIRFVRPQLNVEPAGGRFAASEESGAK